MPELKPGDFLVAGIFIIVNLVTVVTAWVRLKSRIDRNDEIHKEIKIILTNMASDVVTIKTDIAVIKNEQENIDRRLETIEKNK